MSSSIRTCKAKGQDILTLMADMEVGTGDEGVVGEDNARQSDDRAESIWM